MKTISKFLTLFAFLLLVSCGSSKNDSRAIIGNNKIGELVNEMEFEIENLFAFPLSGERIELIGNPNYIRFKNDSVKLFLPYFGERFSGGGYGRPGGIKYEGPIKNLRVEEKDKKTIVKFEGGEGSEFLQFFVTVFPKGKVNTSVNSSERSAISYEGRINELPKKH